MDSFITTIGETFNALTESKTNFFLLLHCIFHPYNTVQILRSLVGIDFKTKVIPIGGKRVELQIWDTAGESKEA